MGSETSSVPNYFDPGHLFHKLSEIAQRSAFDGNHALQARKFTENISADLLIQRSGVVNIDKRSVPKAAKRPKISNYLKNSLTKTVILL